MKIPLGLGSMARGARIEPGFLPSTNLDRTNYKLVQPGDIAYNKMRAWQGAIGVSRNRGIISPAYVVQRPRAGVKSSYFHYLFRIPAFAKEAERWSHGITSDMWSLRPEHFKLIYSCLPSIHEQNSIVRFLDHTNRKIRQYLQAKHRAIELLEEQKQAIIHHAVTCGLDPNVRIKDSGNDFVGKVPEHWEVIPFKRRIRFQEGPGIMAADFRTTGVPLLRISCLLSKRDPLGGCNFLDPKLVDEKWSHFLVQKDNYILNASTSAAHILVQKADEAWIDCVPYTGLIRLWAETNDVSMEYVALLIQSPVIQAQLLLARTGVGIAHFGPMHLKRLWIALPPREEQEQIVTSINEKTNRVIKHIEIINREISLLHQFHKRLITDITTGKLDVREAVSNLPEEIDESDFQAEPEELLNEINVTTGDMEVDLTEPKA
jgi:type I restriction enzyme S subunit